MRADLPAHCGQSDVHDAVVKTDEEEADAAYHQDSVAMTESVTGTMEDRHGGTYVVAYAIVYILQLQCRCDNGFASGCFRGGVRQDGARIVWRRSRNIDGVQAWHGRERSRLVAIFVILLIGNRCLVASFDVNQCRNWPSFVRPVSFLGAR